MITAMTTAPIHVHNVGLEAVPAEPDRIADGQRGVDPVGGGSGQALRTVSSRVQWGRAFQAMFSAREA